jgi:hypothetical protein
MAFSFIWNDPVIEVCLILCATPTSHAVHRQKRPFPPRATSNKPRLPTLLTSQWQSRQSSGGPVYRKVQNQRLHPFIHSFVVNMWRNIHHSRHIKRPTVTFDSSATLPGMDQELCSLTGHSISQCIAALCTRPARHSMPSSADSTLHRSTNRTSVLGPASVIHQTHKWSWHTCQYCTTD